MTDDTNIKALFFDVFGTCVDWRSTVTNALVTTSKAVLNSNTTVLGTSVRNRANDLTEKDWGNLAQQWRNTYKAFVSALARDPTIQWKSVDQHHYDALIDLTREWEIEGLWTTEQVQELTLIWHKLDPWADSVRGMELLNNRFDTTSTLSNGNISLLEDLREYSKIPFTDITSSEEFKSYKPSPKVYLGAVKKFGLQPHQCAMVACHLADLKAAKSNGLRTIYVERPGEEDYNAAEIKEARTAGFVDWWIDDIKTSNGFETVATNSDIR
jgi:2-haloacid dehalogenase